MTELRFDNRVAIITGSGRGLGLGYAKLLASLGAKVVINDNGAALDGAGNDSSVAQQAADEIVAAGGEAIACTDSVTTPEGGEAIVNAALNAWGRLDIVINNAGNSFHSAFEEFTFADFKHSLDIHLMGAFNVSRPAFAAMKKAGYGRFVLTGSIGGIYTMPNVAAYAVGKASMIGLSNVMAIEGAEFGIKSNIILPGAVTRMSEGIDISQFPPMGPEKVAPVVGYLCHEDCAVTAEMLISVAGRVARAYVTETHGLWRDHWSIDDVAANLDAIRDQSSNWTLHPAEGAFGEHLGRSFGMVGGEITHP